jgi:hypothetical protein
MQSGPIGLESEIAIATMEKYKSLVVIKFSQNRFKQEVEY